MDGIGDRIRSQRHVLGLTLRDIACDGVSPGYLSRVERGLRVPSAKALRMLAGRLGVSVHWLETGQDDPRDELARIVLEHKGRPLPPRASKLARGVLGR